jgi:peptidoglycan/xylan/chitin deacetylase (PgdA/CDA1 family)
VIEPSESLARNGVAFFLFHGVVDPREQRIRNYTGKHVDVAIFRAMMERLCDAGEPVGVDHALEVLDGAAPWVENAFVISFDDGFANNRTIAAPVLRELGIPAVLYVTTGFVQDQTGSWIDLIEEAVERTERDELRLPWAGHPVSARSARDRIALLDEVREVVKRRGDLDPYEVATAIREEASVGEFQPDPALDRKLSWDDLRALEADDLFTIGGHSHTHRILSALDPEDLEWEIGTSLDLLRGELTGPVVHYSYPEGLAHCYSESVIDALKRHGVVCSPTAEPGVNPPGTDPFHLRRILVA